MSRAQFTRQELQAGVGQMLAGRVERFGGLDDNDALAVFALILHDGEVTNAEARDVVASLQTYQQDYPKFYAVGFGLLQELLKRTEPPAQAGSKPPPARQDLDARLIGRWSWTKYYSSGTFSSTVNRVMVLGGDGRFAEDGSASANLRDVDSTGRWNGTTSAYSGGNPGERGRWKAQNSILRLDYDDNMYAEYRYEASGQPGDRRLLTRHPASGKEQFWVEF